MYFSARLRQISEKPTRNPQTGNTPLYFISGCWSLLACVRDTSCGLGAPANVGITVGISQICCSKRKVLLFPGLGAILDSRISVRDNTSAYPDSGYNCEQNTYMIPKTYLLLMDVAHFWATIWNITFPPIFVIYSSAILHFRWRLTSTKSCQ